MISNPPFSVVWTTPNHSYDARVETFGEAVELVEKVGGDASHCPTMVEFFEDETGLAFAIGIGFSSSVVTFQESCDPPYFISIGETHAEGVVEFCYGNEPTEYLARNLIPTADAIEALRWFIQRRSRPPQISWERL